MSNRPSTGKKARAFGEIASAIQGIIDQIFETVSRRTVGHCCIDKEANGGPVRMLTYPATALSTPADEPMTPHI